MPILTHADYNFRWTEPAPHGFGQTGCPPCYHEYLQREIYAQDFLDLYIGVPTFNRVPIAGFFYVQITGNPILGGLGIPPHPGLVLMHGVNEYLLVDYDYPWMAELANANNRCIRYIMIAEAAPQQNLRIAAYGLNDNLNSYFYNYQHTQHTLYFTAPCSAFGIHIGTKIDKLIGLANNGVLLLDLFPFAVNYNIGGLRAFLNHHGVSENFLNGTHTYSITNRVEHIADNGLICDNFELNINTVFIAPPQTSYHLGNLINHGLVLPNLIFRMGHNTFHLMVPDIHIAGFIYQGFPPGTFLVAAPGIPNYPITVTRVPILACTAYSGAYTVPSALFIRSALGLL